MTCPTRVGNHRTANPTLAALGVLCLKQIAAKNAECSEERWKTHPNHVLVNAAKVWVPQLDAEETKLTARLHARKDHLTSIADILIAATRICVGCFAVLDRRSTIRRRHGRGIRRRTGDGKDSQPKSISFISSIRTPQGFCCEVELVQVPYFRHEWS